MQLSCFDQKGFVVEQKGFVASLEGAWLGAYRVIGSIKTVSCHKSPHQEDQKPSFHSVWFE